MDAIITAGGAPEPGDPLYEETQGKNKAMLDVAGKPMIQWVLDALCQSTKIDNILIVGLAENDHLQCARSLYYLPGEGSMLQNIRTGVNRLLEIKPQADHVLLVSSDIPSITGEMIDWLVTRAEQTDKDVYYTLVPRHVMEGRFPNSKRSYIKLRGAEVCGGDMNVIRTMTVTGNDELWEKIIAARKNVFKQASLIGYDTLILLLLRLIDINKAVEIATRRLDLTGEAVISPYAEIGMDVDKPHQLAIMRADLSKQFTQERA